MHQHSGRHAVQVVYVEKKNHLYLCIEFFLSKFLCFGSNVLTGDCVCATQVSVATATATATAPVSISHSAMINLSLCVPISKFAFQFKFLFVYIFFSSLFLSLVAFSFIITFIFSRDDFCSRLTTFIFNLFMAIHNSFHGKYCRSSVILVRLTLLWARARFDFFEK